MSVHVYNSDDHQILKWDFQTGDTSLVSSHICVSGLLAYTYTAQVVQLPKDNYATDVHWFPQGAGSKKQSNQSDLFVLACTDGILHCIINQRCRIAYDPPTYIPLIQARSCWCLDWVAWRRQWRHTEEPCWGPSGATTAQHC